jgi:hypothetical protein
MFVSAQNRTLGEIQSNRDSRHTGPADRAISHGKRDRDAISASETRQQIVDRACALVPGSLPYEVVLIDPELVGDPGAVRPLDAFIVRESDGHLRPRVYVNRESSIVRQASQGDDFYVNVLAAVIVHELEHLKGGTERMARRAEERFFEGLIAGGRVSPTDGLRYLALLRHQSDGDH